MKSSKQQERKPAIIPADDGMALYSKVPPQARDLEEAVLGAIMLEKQAMDTVGDIVLPECFYLEKNQQIYKVMQMLSLRNQPIDILTVVEELKSRGELDAVGGAYYVTRLTNSVVSSANIEAHSRIILQKFIQREIIRIGGNMIRDGYSDQTDVFELLDSSEAQILAIGMQHLKKNFSRLGDSLVKVMGRVEMLRHQDNSLTGVPSGIWELDQCTHGWQNTDLIILAARPSVGKTAFALNLACNAAMHAYKPTPVGIFSLEMSESQLVQRMLASESRVHLEKITSGRLDDAGMRRLYDEGVQRLHDAPILIDDTAGLNMFELRAKARRMKNKHKVGLIIVDYLQLMTGDTNKSDNREREISKISRELKKLAKDLEVPVIALSQLSRKVEERGRGQKVPLLSDLRESGAIEQDADLVMFLYRPPEDEVRDDAELRNRGMVKIAKHRNGRLDEIVLKFFGEIQKWMDLRMADQYERDTGFVPLPRVSGAGAKPNSGGPAAPLGDADDFPF